MMRKRNLNQHDDNENVKSKEQKEQQQQQQPKSILKTNQIKARSQRSLSWTIGLLSDLCSGAISWVIFQF